MRTNYTNNANKRRSSFTLIELLVVLALVAILSVVVILTLNPAELLKQARDSNRLSDLSTINTSLNLFSSDVINGFMGTSTVVYVSIPSTISTCSDLGLPTLPTGYTYNCVTTQNLRNTDGSGWIPVNFQRISSNSPISQLPIDPTNTTTTRLYYTYTPGGSWELNATVEASKNKLGGSGDLASKDGGSSPSQYEIGNNLNLSPIETGDTSLVGYWNFEEGPNATSSDKSGYGNHGTWYGTSTESEHYTTGKVGSYAGYFNGGSDYIVPGTILATDVSACSWISSKDSSLLQNIIGGSNNSIVRYMSIQTSIFKTNDLVSWRLTTTTISSNTWYHVCLTFESTPKTLSLYVNGVSEYNSSGLGNATYGNMSIVGSYVGGTQRWFYGSIDDIRLYNRALSAAEISALYNATK